MNLYQRIKALPVVKDEHGDECISREVVLELLTQPPASPVAPAPLTRKQVEAALDAAIGAVIDPVPDCVPRSIVRDIQMDKLTDELNRLLAPVATGEDKPHD
jgi:hypothetical protein